MIKGLHVIILLTLIVFGGCSVKHQITQSEPYLITIKTPQMAFSDIGFLNQAPQYTQLQIFSAGTLLLNMEMQENICLDGTCMEALAFNNRFFGTEHYAQLLHDIVHKKPLYEGRNYTKSEGGFSQEILLPNAHIFYKVEGDARSFKETQHAVLIRLRPLP
jgi:hypothetical protein